MTSEWKIKQDIYHRLNTEHTDDLNKVDIVIRKCKRRCPASLC